MATYGPTVQSRVTLHTIWQAVTGENPPLDLPPRPVPVATLDSRDVVPGALFIPQVGSRTDGHNYIGAALQNGASVVLSEERGRAQAEAAGAAIVDCASSSVARMENLELPANYSLDAPLVFLVRDATRALQAVGGFQRTHRTRSNLYTIGITGSIGKTSTKELVAAVMRQRYTTLASRGNLNSEQGLPLTLLSLDESYECAVLEMGMYALGEIATLAKLGRPRIGIVTNVGPVHMERLGTIENIARAKSELPRLLPPAADGGVAILNWDDANVRAMAEVTRAAIFRYGLTSDADLWADEISSAGMEGIYFRLHHRLESGNVESIHVKAPLLGRHSVHTALRAAAAGLVAGMEWEEIVSGMQSMPAQLRLVTVPGIHGSTVIDDTYNASPESTIAALNLLADLTPKAGGRRIAVLGDMRELGDYTDEGHKLVGVRAAIVVDILVTVGGLGRLIGEEARAAGFSGNALHIMQTDAEAVQLLHTLLTENDLVLVKGSRAVGMDSVVAQIVLAPDLIDSASGLVVGDSPASATIAGN